jgi:hypothetical protein
MSTRHGRQVTLLLGSELVARLEQDAEQRAIPRSQLVDEILSRHYGVPMTNHIRRKSARSAVKAALQQATPEQLVAIQELLNLTPNGVGK